MSQENVELIRAAYEEFNRTGQPVLWGFDPEVEYHTRADLPDSSVHRGLDGVAALHQGWIDSFEDLGCVIEDVIDRDPYLIVPLVLHGRIRGSGEEVSMPETHVHKFRDGMGVEVREYATLDEALKAVGLEG